MRRAEAGFPPLNIAPVDFGGALSPAASKAAAASSRTGRRSDRARLRQRQSHGMLHSTREGIWIGAQTVGARIVSQPVAARRLVPLDQIAPMLLEAHRRHGSGRAGRVLQWIEHLAADNPGGKRHRAQAGCHADRRLADRLDRRYRRHRIIAVAALGDVRVARAITNANLDGGPLLFVGGDLEATRIERAARTSSCSAA